MSVLSEGGTYACVVADPAKDMNSDQMKKFISNPFVSVSIILSPRLPKDHESLFASSVYQVTIPVWSDKEYTALFKIRLRNSVLR